MRRKLYIPASLLAIFGLLSLATTPSCTYDYICPDNFPCDSASLNQPCDSNVIYFEKDILPILVSNCAQSGCHDAATARNGVNLTNYNSVITTGDIEAGEPDKSELYEVLVSTDPDKRMPPSPRASLSNTQIDLIKKWIEDGAKNETCNSTVICETIDVSYASEVKPVLETFCVACHSTSSAGGGVNLETLAGVRLSAASNRLYGSINHEQGFQPMPRNGSKLDNCTIAKIKSWIDDGMKDN